MNTASFQMKQLYYMSHTRHLTIITFTRQNIAN